MRISTLPSSGDSDFGQPIQDSATSKLPTGINEHAGRCPVAFEGARRMDVSSYCGKKEILSLRSTDDRSVCVTEKQTVGQILLHGPARSPRFGDRRATTELGLQEPVALRLPSPQSSTSGSGADVQSQLSDDSGDSMVAESTMAIGADQIISPTPIQVAGEIGHDFELDDQQAVARLPQVTHDGMAHLSSTLQDGGGDCT